MTTIRLVEYDDFSEVFRMGKLFMEESSLIQRIGWDWNSVKKLTHQFVDLDQMVGLVVEDGDQLIGMIGLVIAPHLFNDEYIVAEELVWWIAPEHRKTIGFKLLEVAEEVCRLKGADEINMRFLHSEDMRADLMERMYKRKGYRKVETAMGKEL